jgi:hypothetical protein
VGQVDPSDASHGSVIRVGKHRFLRIVDLPAGRHGADKHPG